MLQAKINFSQGSVQVEFESEYAFVKWLGYLKEHGLATVKASGSPRSIIVFRDNISYIESEGEANEFRVS